jgi:hypothetical protein
MSHGPETASTQAERRRELYRTDPLWRLTKLKDNRERRLRAKRAADERTHLLD